jgi:hypothetical protein
MQLKEDVEEKSLKGLYRLLIINIFVSVWQIIFSFTYIFGSLLERLNHKFYLTDILP